MVEFITRCCHAENRYEVIVKTDSEEHYKATQDFARRLIDHAKPMTNADSIRAMSDEELAVWITSIRLDTINEMCKKFGVEIEIPPPTAENTADVYEWLKQPAE